MIGNRDEFHERPTAPLARRAIGVIAGRALHTGRLLGAAADDHVIIGRQGHVSPKDMRLI